MRFIPLLIVLTIVCLPFFLLWLVSRWIPNAKALTIQRQACLKSTDTMSTAEGLRRCREYGLEGPAGYLDLPVDTVDKVWNGMGPDRFSAVFSGCPWGMDTVTNTATCSRVVIFKIFCSASLMRI